MKITKTLENKIVIQFFGAALLVSPFINALLSIYFDKTITGLWTFSFFLKVLAHGNFIQILLKISSAAIGTYMLSGSTKAWRYVLGLLLGHIVIQISQLGKNLKVSSIYGVIFLVNVFIFYYILDQLVLKQKPTLNKQSLNNEPISKNSTKTLSKINSNNLKNDPNHNCVKYVSKKKLKLLSPELPENSVITTINSKFIKIKTPPISQKINIHQRIKISINSLPSLRAQLVKQEDDTLTFEFVDTSENQILSLNQWLARFKLAS